MFGKKIKRVEDPRFLRGAGKYVDDIHLPNMTHAAFVRSPIAHGRIVSTDITRALAIDKVIAIYFLEDLLPYLSSSVMPLEQASNMLHLSANPSVLADVEVCYVGEPIACVIAETPYIAEDAASLVNIVYEDLPPSTNYIEALKPDAVRAHSNFPDNHVAGFTLSYGNVEEAFHHAKHVFQETLFQHKGLGHSIECRGVAARVESSDNILTVWSATQMAHRAHNIIAEMLGLPEDELRVLAPDVGGGFGPKFVFYHEEIVVPLAALLLRRPVKWVEDRREHFTCTTQERDQCWDLEVAINEQGCLLGVRGKMMHDHGAYTPYGVNLPFNGATNFLGPYKLPNLYLDVSLALTNLTPVTPVRGAGRPQGTFAMERLMDRISRELKLDRIEVRKRNLIQPESMPYDTQIKTRDGAIMTYDTGNYPATMREALEKSGYNDFTSRQLAARQDGRYIGIGIANYVEGTGRGPFESAIVRIKPSGKLVILTGATDQGQGLKTSLAQICAAQLGANLDNIEVVTGDTAAISLGLGAFASRQAVTAGSAVHVAAVKVKEKAIKVAAHMLEISENDLEIAAGKIFAKGIPEMSVSLGDVARAVQGMPGFSLPGGVDPGMEACSYFSPKTLTYCNGVHIAEVDVDIGTGQVKIIDYLIVHDSGRLINPTIVEGQITGGAAHGIGSALFERMIFDDQGQPQTTNLGEYLLPTATDLPTFKIIHMESPTPLNPLGVKGAGEGGTIPVTSVIASAVDDALAPFGVFIQDLPIEPKQLVELIQRANK